MNGKELGQTRITLPEVGLGTWRYSGGIAPVRKGVELGASLIDTAESYGSEDVVGQAVKGIRDRTFIATKISAVHFKYAEVLKAADQSLRRLDIDHIDLYQLHCANFLVPIAETLAAMEKLVELGKVRFIGVSNFSVGQLKKAQKCMQKNRIVSNQVRYNLVDRTIEPRLLPYCQANGVTVIAYSPLARRFQRISDGDPHGCLAKIGKSTGKTAAQISINWCLCKDRVVAIPKASSIEHVEDNCGASGWRLSPEDVKTLDENVTFRRRSHLETMMRHYGISGLVQLVKSAVRRSGE
jgi:diketogulonate reductase-like aldo/keto reductase